MLAFVILCQMDCKSAQAIRIDVSRPEMDFADNAERDEWDGSNVRAAAVLPT